MRHVNHMPLQCIRLEIVDLVTKLSCYVKVFNRTTMPRKYGPIHHSAIQYVVFIMSGIVFQNGTHTHTQYNHMHTVAGV